MGVRTPQAVINALKKKGRTLHLQHRWFGPEWRLSDGTVVDPEVARIVTRSKSVASVGDSLFGDALAQTWRYIEVQEVARRPQRRTQVR
jgi:hypothetical protein